MVGPFTDGALGTATGQSAAAPAPEAAAAAPAAARAGEHAVTPSTPFSNEFKQQKYQQNNQSPKTLVWPFLDLYSIIVSSISAGAQWCSFWVCACANSVSANPPYILVPSDSDPRAYRPVGMIPVGVGVHQGIVQKGDSILLSDGSIWQVQQPLVCTYDGAFAADAKQVWAGCEHVCLYSSLYTSGVVALAFWISV
jgi:hypothetical protein